MTEPTSEVRVDTVASESHDLYDDGWIRKARSGEGADSNQTGIVGRREHVVDFNGLEFLRERSSHHMRCLTAKQRYVSSGGFRDQSIYDTLGPLCEDGMLQPLLDFIAYCLAEFHEGAIEVVRTGGRITGLHPLHPQHYWVHREQNVHDYHYEIRSRGGFLNTPAIEGLRFARFGDKEAMMARLGIDAADADQVSEVIRFSRDKNVLSEDYGTPEWLPGIPYMELETCQVQYRFDFFFNGCVPDTIYTVSGGRLSDKGWKELNNTLRNDHQGLGKRRKIMVVNIDGEDMEVRVDQLDAEAEGTSDSEDQSSGNALAVVTAHGVPPLIAGIMVPGKAGAANEFPNAIQAFQAQYAGPVQVFISHVFACSLGNPQLNGGLGVSADSFLGRTSDEMEPDPTDPTGMQMRKKDLRGNGFYTILDAIDIDKADTISRMRTPLAQAQGQGRDLNAGLAERGSDVGAGRGTRS